VSPTTSNDRITVLEANLDDLSPQVLAYAMERLLAEGALDVFSVPVQMKKGRSGALLTVLAKIEDANRLTRLIFAETTTLGVAPPRGTAPDPLATLGKCEYRLGAGANQSGQHERHSLELRAGITKIAGRWRRRSTCRSGRSYKKRSSSIFEASGKREPSFVSGRRSSQAARFCIRASALAMPQVPNSDAPLGAVHRQIEIMSQKVLHPRLRSY